MLCGQVSSRGMTAKVKDRPHLINHSLHGGLCLTQLSSMCSALAGGPGRSHSLRTHAQSSSKKTKKPKLPLHGNDLNGKHCHACPDMQCMAPSP